MVHGDNVKFPVNTVLIVSHWHFPVKVFLFSFSVLNIFLECSHVGLE